MIAIRLLFILASIMPSQAPAALSPDTSPVGSGTELVAPLDEFGLPGPTWVFELLLPATFFLHVIFMNFAFGSGLLVLPIWLAGRRRPHLLSAVGLMLRAWPIALSLTITTGIAPLLFVQVLYGHVFYPANILMGWRWLAILGLLIVAFYAIYLVRAKPADAGVAVRPDPGFARGLVLLVIAACMLLIAAFFTMNSTVMLVPEAWRSIRAGDSAPWQAHAMFWPRYLHNVVGSMAIASLSIAVLARTSRKIDPAHRSGVIGFGLWMTAVWTTVQIMLGIWFVATIWSDGQAAFHQPTPGTILWAVAVLSGMAAFFVLMFYAIHHCERPAAVWLPTGLLTLTLIGMSAGRERVRVGLLDRVGAARYGPANQFVQPVTLLLFGIVLVIGLAILAMMARWVYTAGGSAGELPNADAELNQTPGRVETSNLNTIDT